MTTQKRVHYEEKFQLFCENAKAELTLAEFEELLSFVFAQSRNLREVVSHEIAIEKELLELEEEWNENEQRH